MLNVESIYGIWGTESPNTRLKVRRWVYCGGAGVPAAWLITVGSPGLPKTPRGRTIPEARLILSPRALGVADVGVQYCAVSQ
jgi:hypothetical protein